jgi:hypothetical protein
VKPAFIQESGPKKRRRLGAVFQVSHFNTLPLCSQRFRIGKACHPGVFQFGKVSVLHTEGFCVHSKVLAKEMRRHNQLQADAWTVPSFCRISFDAKREKLGGV